MREFSSVTREAASHVDLLASWVPGENFIDSFPQAMTVTKLGFLDPIFAPQPWTAALKGKTVLVVHPFSRTIRSQYAKRQLLFPDPDFLPDFRLKLLMAPQTINDGEDFSQLEHASWFDALDFMKSSLDSIDFDVALIGAGAYGMPLAAHVKKMGRVAIHLGGHTQLLFGIMGNRWEASPTLASIRNEHWARPAPEETPPLAPHAEGAAYW